MRSIGKVKIKKLKQIIEDDLRSLPETPFWTNPDLRGVKDRVWEKVPSEWLDTWEGAYSEIERIICDTILEKTYNRK